MPPASAYRQHQLPLAPASLLHKAAIACRRQFWRLGLAFALGLQALAAPCASAPLDQPVTADGPAGKLGGTMTSPKRGDTGPVAVIIPGSGPTDRDGNSPMGVRAGTYRLLAEGLADRGVTTVRIDKRGMFESHDGGDPNAVTITAYAEDMRAWITKARALTGTRCVWLIGHSEGALVALATARDPGGICGLVLIAGAGRPIGTVLRTQLKANPANAPILDEALAAIDALEAGRHLDTAQLSPPLRGLFNAPAQGFLIDMMTYDPVRLAAAYRGPILVLQGETDLQVSTQDARLLADARPGIKLSLVAGANHVLKSAPLDRAANLATYATPNLPLVPGAVEAISTFIKN